MSNDNLPARFRALQHLKGWSTAEAAVAFRVTARSWENWTAGANRPRLVHIRRLERYERAMERSR